jgi:hypothetical protein
VSALQQIAAAAAQARRIFTASGRGPVLVRQAFVRFGRELRSPALQRMTPPARSLAYRTKARSARSAQRGGRAVCRSMALHVVASVSAS